MAALKIILYNTRKAEYSGQTAIKDITAHRIRKDTPRNRASRAPTCGPIFRKEPNFTGHRPTQLSKVEAGGPAIQTDHTEMMTPQTTMDGALVAAQGDLQARTDHPKAIPMTQAAREIQVIMEDLADQEALDHQAVRVEMVDQEATEDQEILETPEAQDPTSTRTAYTTQNIPHGFKLGTRGS